MSVTLLQNHIPEARVAATILYFNGKIPSTIVQFDHPTTLYISYLPLYHSTILPTDNYWILPFYYYTSLLLDHSTIRPLLWLLRLLRRSYVRVTRIPCWRYPTPRCAWRNLFVIDSRKSIWQGRFSKSWKPRHARHVFEQAGLTTYPSWKLEGDT